MRIYYVEVYDSFWSLDFFISASGYNWPGDNAEFVLELIIGVAGGKFTSVGFAEGGLEIRRRENKFFKDASGKTCAHDMCVLSRFLPRGVFSALSPKG